MVIFVIENDLYFTSGEFKKDYEAKKSEINTWEIYFVV